MGGETTHGGGFGSKMTFWMLPLAFDPEQSFHEVEMLLDCVHTCFTTFTRVWTKIQNEPPKELPKRGHKTCSLCRKLRNCESV